jgi:hypothetical protein
MPGRGVTRAELEPFFGTLSLPFSSVAYPKKGFGPPRVEQHVAEKQPIGV